MTQPLSATRSLAAIALAGAACLGLGIGMGPGEAVAQSDNLAEIRSLQARVDQLSAQVAMLDALIVTQGPVTTISGARRGDAIVLRANPATAQLIRVGDKDAVLSFRRIAINADEIALTGRNAITLKAPAITLDGAVQAKGSSDVTVKGNKLGGN